jgi:hypothetical protein
VLAVHTLKPYALPVWQEAPLVLAATATACVLTYEVGRRARVLRTLFGLKALGSPGPGHDAASAVEAGRTRPA